MLESLNKIYRETAWWQPKERAKNNGFMDIKAPSVRTYIESQRTPIFSYQGTGHLRTWTVRVERISNGHPCNEHRPQRVRRRLCAHSICSGILGTLAGLPSKVGPWSVQSGPPGNAIVKAFRCDALGHFKISCPMEQKPLIASKVNIDALGKVRQFFADSWADLVRRDAVGFLLVFNWSDKPLIPSPQMKVLDLICLNHNKCWGSMQAVAMRAIMADKWTVQNHPQS